MSKSPISELTGVQRFVVQGSRTEKDASVPLTLKNPRIVVNFLGKNIESYSFDQDSFKFPFQAHVNEAADLGKQVSVKLYDD
jgi:hypothetical protein